MNNLKTFVLAAVLVVGLAICGGGATASAATQLCSTNTSPCTGTEYGVGTEFKAELETGTEAVFKAGFATVKCKASILGWKLDQFSNGTPRGTSSTVSFSECGGCTVAGVPQGTIEEHTDGATANGNGIVTAVGPEITMSCLGVNCTYGTGTGITLGTVDGGNPALMTGNANLPWQAGAGHSSLFLCGNPAQFTATYRFNSPKPLFIE
jgi:hypothetical protein